MGSERVRPLEVAGQYLLLVDARAERASARNSDPIEPNRSESGAVTLSVRGVTVSTTISSTPDQPTPGKRQGQPNSGESANDFPRSKRLLTPGDYSRVFANNVRVNNRYWTILAGTGQGQHARLGLAIAKKRAKRAVDRNRLKRLVRDSFRQRGVELGLIDVVVMNRDACIGAENSELLSSLDGLWNKLAIKCKSLS